MRTRRSELRDELTAMIAAGRELSPDHDRVLAEVFIDRVEGRIAPQSRASHTVTVWSKPRRLLGVIVVGLACLGTGSVLTIHHASSSPVQAPLSAKMPAGPLVGKVPIGPLGGKMSAVPSAPKAPLAPKAPGLKTAP
jgi:hypothetical protein